MIVLDTHVWLWWLSNPEMISQDAVDAIHHAVEENNICISSISAWEITMLVSKGRLELTLDPRDWIRKTEALPFVNFIPVDNTIAMRSVSLPGIFHDDPADRIIVATTMTIGAKLISKDRKIRDYPNIETVW